MFFTGQVVEGIVGINGFFPGLIGDVTDQPCRVVNIGTAHQHPVGSVKPRDARHPVHQIIGIGAFDAIGITDTTHHSVYRIIGIGNGILPLRSGHIQVLDAFPGIADVGVRPRNAHDIGNLAGGVIAIGDISIGDRLALGGQPVGAVIGIGDCAPAVGGGHGQVVFVISKGNGVVRIGYLAETISTIIRKVVCRAVKPHHALQHGSQPPGQ